MKQRLYHQFLRYGWVLVFLIIIHQSSICQAQTISQREIQGTTALVNGGQSFTATMDGYITSIRVLVAKSAESRTLHFFDVTTATDNGLLSNALYTDANQINLETGWNDIMLTAPFAVTKGEQYGFSITGTIVYKTNFSNIYKSGAAFNNKILTASRTDLVFEIFEETEE